MSRCALGRNVTYHVSCRSFLRPTGRKNERQKRKSTALFLLSVMFALQSKHNRQQKKSTPMSSLADASDAEERVKSAKPRRHRRLNWLPYALALPIVLYEIALIVYPIAQGVYG